MGTKQTKMGRDGKQITWTAKNVVLRAMNAKLSHKLAVENATTRLGGHCRQHPEIIETAAEKLHFLKCGTTNWSNSRSLVRRHLSRVRRRLQSSRRSWIGAKLVLRATILRNRVYQFPGNQKVSADVTSHMVLNRGSCSCRKVIDSLYSDGKVGNGWVSQKEAARGERCFDGARLTAAFRQSFTVSQISLPALSSLGETVILVLPPLLSSLLLLFLNLCSGHLSTRPISKPFHLFL